MNRYLAVSLLIGLELLQWVYAGWVYEEQVIMGTKVRAEVWHPEDAMAREGIRAVMAELRRIDRLMSPYNPDSELSRLNAQAADKPIAVAPELFDLVVRTLEFSRLTDGAFDITFASVGHLYDFRKQVKPTREAVDRTLSAVDYRKIRLDRRAGTIYFARPGMKLDLGGIAKGYAVDRALAILKHLDIQHALVSAGGDTGILGDRRGRPWVVAIRDPRFPEAIAAMLPMENEALSTSGDYERYFEQDGVRYHHILNPVTGEPAGKVRSVSVIGPDATTTDALSTGVFVMGVEQGMALIDKLPDIEAVIVDASGALFYSRGLADVRQ